MFIFKVGSDEVKVRTYREFKYLSDKEKISYVWDDLWPDDLGMTWIEKVLYDHDTGDLGLPEIWDEYVSEFYPERYREIENEEGTEPSAASLEIKEKEQVRLLKEQAAKEGDK